MADLNSGLSGVSAPQLVQLQQQHHQPHQGPPIPAVRTSSLQPVPQPRTTQALVHHHPATVAAAQQQPQPSQQQQKEPQHLQPQVIIASGAPGIPQQQPQQQQQQQQQHQPSSLVASQNPQPPNSSNQIFTTTGLLSGPRFVVLHRHNGDFGFTLRHFIVYPPPEATPDPNTDRLAAAAGMPNFAQPMDTVFVKKVHPNSPAFLAGLQEGDRLLAVNGISVASIPYAQVVATIQQTPKTLTLQVVPKNYDLLQTYFSETAYNPETNQRPQPQQLFLPKAASTPNATSRSSGVKRILTDVQEKQESLYSTLQEIVENATVAGGPPIAAAASANANKPIYAEVPKIRSPPIAAETPALQMAALQPQLQQQQQQHQQQQQQHQQQYSHLQPPQQLQRSKPLVFDFDPIKQQHYLAQQQHLHQQQQQQQQQLQQHQQLQQQHHHQQKLLQHGKDSDSISSYDSVKSAANLSVNDVLMAGGDSAIMSRLRKSFEQKEEFLRRPAPVPHPAPFDVQQREFYGRPQRLQKSVWPPPPSAAVNVSQSQQPQQPLQQQSQQQQQQLQQQQSSVIMPVITTTNDHDSLMKPSKMSSGTQTTSHGTTKSAPIANTANTTSNTSNSLAAAREQHTSHLSAIREQFFSGFNGVSQNHHQSHLNELGFGPAPRSAPPSLALQRDQMQQYQQQSQQQPQQQQQLSGSQSSLPLAPQGLHIVSEKAKLFESGRPLSPDGIDRAELYKSELSRINTKQVVPNVAVRRKEFELKAESTGWRRSTEEKPRSVSSDSDSHRTPVRVRSLSVESGTPKDSPLFYPSSDGDQQLIFTKEGGPSPGACTLLRQRPVRENSYRNAVRNSTDPASSQVVLRQKQHQINPVAIEEDDRKTRRISYLRATAHENLFPMESDPSDSSPMSLPPDTPDTEPEAIADAAAAAPTGAVGGAGSGSEGTAEGSLQLQQQQQQQSQQQQLQPQQLKSHSAKSKALAHFRDSPADPASPVVRKGELNIKITLIDGKRSQDRSWRPVHAELRGSRLKLTLLRDGKSSSQSPEPSGIIDLTNFHVAEGNYTKRKNVFKLTTVSYQPTSAQSHQHLAVHHTQSASGGLAGLAAGGSASSAAAAGSLYKGYERELLLQADSHNDMRLWMDSLRTVCRSSQFLNSSDYINNLGGQQAEPQRVAALTSVQSTSNDEFSPVLSAKSHRKYALGSRSPSGQSPVTKSRKTPQQNSAAVLTPAAVANANSHSHSGKESSDKETGSPKSKTWKGIVARQFRKMQGQPGSPGAQNPEMLLPDGASISVPLQLCPPSDENPYVPLLLAKCTSIVESKGLSVIGIYRIPGNTAAISQLTEQINRGMDEVTLRDPKWEDVNVVSSLLKSFIRNLPEPLLPNEMYHSFINADKLPGQQRLIELKQLLKRIPNYNYETLKHLMRHLNVVSTNTLVNLMDPRNLAIVFGPSVVRSVNESLETAVKDMKHQCQIVEVLINHYQYFFEDDLLPSVLEKQSTTTVDSGLEVPSASLLLDNVSKIEPFKESSKESSSHFVAQIVQAANRKIRRTAQRKSTMSSTTPDTLSLDSTTSAESKEQSSRPSHRYLHGGSASGGTGCGVVAGAGGGSIIGGNGVDQVGPAGVIHSEDSQKENMMIHHQQQQQQQQTQQHHHHHHHFFHHHAGNRHHSSQSNDDNSSVLNRSSEEDSNDSAFADNGSMSLKTVTIALDNKLRSLRNSSIDSDRDVADTTLESDCDNSSSCYSGTTPAGPIMGTNGGTPTRRSVHHSRPLTLGENIPYADESPERPLIQSRSKPLRQHSNNNINGKLGNFTKSSDAGNSNSNLINNNTGSASNNSSTTTNNNNNNSVGAGCPDDSVKSSLSQKSLDSSGGGMTTNSGSANDSCVTLVNEREEDEEEEDKVNNISLSSDDTDTSTTSNPREKLTATYRIDTEVLKKMNRILTNLERKANNLERKFNLNRSLSLNYKNHKNLECCCGHAVTTVGTGTIPVQPCCNNNNLHNHQNNNSVSVNNSLNVRSRLSLTKDEKTDKNINRRRQIHDVSQIIHQHQEGGGACCGEHHHIVSSQGPQIILTPTANSVQPNNNSGGGGGGGGRHRRQLGNRSIRRRHTVGGTHDYCSNKIVNNHNGAQCQQQQQQQQQQLLLQQQQQLQQNQQQQTQQSQQNTAGRGGSTGCTSGTQQGLCGGDEKGCKDLD